MKLIDIDKTRYRKHLNIIIIAFIAVFMALSLAFGQGLIAVFAENNGAEQTSNFRYNLAGVVLALLACAAILSQLREKDFFYEVYYVWQIKQLINLIYRKMTVIKNIAAQTEHPNNRSALIVLYYYYQAATQLYQLDDNTLTLSSLTKDKEALQVQINALNISIDSEDFDKNMLALFKSSHE